MRFLVAFLTAAVAALAAECAATSRGLAPLNDPFFFRYQGLRGGLYPDGQNKRPAAHETVGLRLAAEVRPRNASGAVDEQNGRIVFLSVGMSNTTQEFSMFKALADRDPDKNPRVAIGDGAQGGWSADRIVAGGDEYWRVVEQRLTAAGVAPAQVQTAWMKQADAQPRLAFPEDARRLQAELKAIAQTLRSRFPNLRLLYLSSRIYAGYASTPLNPEPYAYQSAFAVKWLIEEQIQGSPELSFDAGRVPWMAWGPYLWADGMQTRPDGLTWRCADFENDGTHPAAAARQKVAAMLLDFLKSDTTARTWFVRAASPAPPAAPIALVEAAGFAASVAAGSIATLFGAELAGGSASALALPLPVTLAGASVEIGGEPAYLLYVSSRQINLVLPAAPAGGSVVVTRDGARSAPAAAPLSFYAPGLFTLDGTGKGPAAALHADGRVVTAADPARRGETIMLFATGFGVRNPQLAIPEFLPVVRIGGFNAELTYSGPAPGFPGLNQVNVVIPLEAPIGPEVQLDLQLASFRSNTVTLAVAPEN